MTKYSTPAHAIRAYFESYGRLASAKGLVFSGMPISSGGDNLQVHMQANHGDLVLLLKDCTTDEMQALALHYASAAGLQRYSRYVGSPHDALPDEHITRNSHPDDPSMIEVTGEVVRGHAHEAIAEIMGISKHRAGQLLASARHKIGERLKNQESDQ